MANGCWRDVVFELEFWETFDGVFCSITPTAELFSVKRLGSVIEVSSFINLVQIAETNKPAASPDAQETATVLSHLRFVKDKLDD